MSAQAETRLWDTLRAAGWAGDLSMLQALYRDGQLDSQDLFVAVCGRGHLAVAQWLHGLGGVEAHVGGLAGFRAACCNGKLHVAQWLHGLGGVDVRGDSEAHLFWACKGGHLHTAQWLHSLGAAVKPDVFLELPWAVDKWAVTKWLVELGGMERHVRMQSDTAFMYACHEGNLEAAQWLVGLGAVNVDAFAWQGFYWAIIKGRVRLARWLRQLGGLDVHEDPRLGPHGWAFCTACLKMHVDLAKWLYSLGGVNVHERQNMALIGLLSDLHDREDPQVLHFARWLVSLDTRDGVWPAHCLALLKCWSPTRDAWMRSVVCAPQLP